MPSEPIDEELVYKPTTIHSPRSEIVELCEEKGIDIAEFVRLTGIDRRTAELLFDEEADAALTPAIAKRLGPISCIKPLNWLRWEARYRAFLADQAERDANTGEAA
jgi:plasmid maintenance system antidote protein VapI